MQIFFSFLCRHFLAAFRLIEDLFFMFVLRIVCGFVIVIVIVIKVFNNIVAFATFVDVVVVMVLITVL